MQNQDDPLGLLGIGPEADVEEVRAAYESAVLKCYGSSDDPDSDAVRHELQRIHEAYIAALRAVARGGSLAGRKFSAPDLARMELARVEAGAGIPEAEVLKPVGLWRRMGWAVGRLWRRLRPRGGEEGPLGTEADEPAIGGGKRRVAFTFVYVLWGAGLALGCAAAYAWWRTLRMTLQFIKGGSIDLASGADQSPIDKLLRLDISTMSALVLFLLALFLLLGTSSLIVKRLRCGSWGRFASHVQPDRLVPEPLGAVSVRLGLIGTLLSFVLIAMMLFRGTGAEADTSRWVAVGAVRRQQAGGNPVARPARESAASQPAGGSSASQPTSRKAASQPTSRSAASQPAAAGRSQGPWAATGLGGALTQRSSRTSYRVFLLLCASLYSTLVGCGVGYFVVPVINGVGAVATGQSAAPAEDVADAQEEYSRRVRAAATELSLLTEQAAVVRLLTGDLAPCVILLRDTQRHLERVRREMEQTVGGLKETHEIRESVQEATGELRKVCGSIGQVAEQHAVQAEQSREMNARLQETAEAATRGFAGAMGELKTLAEAVRTEAVAPSGRLVGSIWDVIGALKENVGGVFRVLRRQQSLTEEAASSIAACAKPIEAATGRITKVAEEMRRIARSNGRRRARSAADPAAIGQLAAADLDAVLDDLRGCLDAIRTQQTQVEEATAEAEVAGEAAGRSIIRRTDEVQQLAEGINEQAGPLERAGFWRRLFEKRRR